MPDIGALTKIVGKGNALSAEEALQEYAGDLSFMPAIKPSCVIKVTSAEQVKAVIDWANETRTPIVPVSSGPPHTRGDTVPTIGGAIILNMSGMKKIIDISYKEQRAIVEPGVTFGELIPALEKERLRPHMPLLPRPTKSVIGSYLEKEPILQPRHHWCSIDPLLVVQTILGSGDLLQTGSSKGLWTLEEEWEQKKAQKWWNAESYDVVLVSQSSQGTVSVLTWASIKCALLPEVHQTYLVASDKLEPLIDFAYLMLRYRWGEELFILNDQAMASIMAESADEIIPRRATYPPYTLVLGIAGFPDYFPEERVEVQTLDAQELAEKFGLGLRPNLDGLRGEDLINKIYAPPAGIPWKQKAKGAYQDIFFVTTLENTPRFVDQVNAMSRDYDYPTTDIGVYIQPIVQGTSCHCEFNLVYDPESPIETSGVERFVTQGAERLAEAGAYFYRPYGSWKDIAYSNINGEEYAAMKKIKEIFDPRGVLNPGKVCF
jgi:FAD/FMN-containing dehydrogenase